MIVVTIDYDLVIVIVVAAIVVMVMMVAVVTGFRSRGTSVNTPSGGLRHNLEERLGGLCDRIHRIVESSKASLKRRPSVTSPKAN